MRRIMAILALAMLVAGCTDDVGTDEHATASGPSEGYVQNYLNLEFPVQCAKVLFFESSGNSVAPRSWSYIETVIQPQAIRLAQHLRTFEVALRSSEWHEEVAPAIDTLADHVASEFREATGVAEASAKGSAVDAFEALHVLAGESDPTENVLAALGLATGSDFDTSACYPNSDDSGDSAPTATSNPGQGYDSNDYDSNDYDSNDYDSNDYDSNDCVGDCTDMDDDGRTANDVDADGDGRYETPP